MSRFERKCFVGSAIMHGSLLLVFFFGAAFLPSKKSEKLPPVITLLAIPTDRPISSGGNPNGNPEPPAPAQPPEKIEPPQPPPPEPPKPEVKKEVEKVEPRKEVVRAEKEKGDVPVQAKKQPDKKQTETANTKPRISTKTVIRTNNTARPDRERAEELARYNAERQRLASQINGIVNGVGKSLNKNTVAAPLGPGGEAFVNYGSLVREIYDRAWHVGQDLTDNDSATTAQVTIQRDGRVLRAVISRRSGNSTLDRSVQRALDSVRDIGAPFPAGAKEAERTFTIEFNLRTKRALG